MNKVAIITGASSGIGYATANEFIERGWQVINLSRRPCDILAVSNITVDLSYPGWVDAVTQPLHRIAKDASQICLIHNAAQFAKDSIDNLPADSFRYTLEINVVAPVILNQIVIPLMQPRSSIIYIGSTLAEKAVKNTASYVVTKHALVGMMRATCQDLEGKGIHTACVCPGFTDTEMLRTHVGHDQAILNEIAKVNALKRLILPSEIADTIYFCAEHPVINGAVLHANMGQLEH